MYTYTHTNIDTNTENNQMRLTKIYANKYNCIKFLIQTTTQLEIHSYIYIYIHKYMHNYVNVCVYAYVCVYLDI